LCISSNIGVIKRVARDFRLQDKDTYVRNRLGENERKGHMKNTLRSSKSKSV